MREAESKKPGYQRLRIMQYDELRRKLTSSQGLTVGREAVRETHVLLMQALQAAGRERGVPGPMLPGGPVVRCAAAACKQLRPAQAGWLEPSYACVRAERRAD